MKLGASCADWVAVLWVQGPKLMSTSVVEGHRPNSVLYMFCHTHAVKSLLLRKNI